MWSNWPIWDHTGIPHRATTAILLLLNKYPILCYSKEESLSETSDLFLSFQCLYVPLLSQADKPSTWKRRCARSIFNRLSCLTVVVWRLERDRSWHPVLFQTCARCQLPALRQVAAGLLLLCCRCPLRMESSADERVNHSGKNSKMKLNPR